MPSVTRRPQGNREARRAEVSGRLLEAVERLTDGGESFTEISVERLVAEAGISRSTFYVYFEDKGMMLAALSEDVLDAMMATSRAWWDLRERPTREQLRETFRAIGRLYREHRTLMGAVMDSSAYDTEVRARFASMVQTGREQLAQHMLHGQREGYVRAELDAPRTSGWIAWMLERGLYELVRPASARETRALMDALAGTLWAALYESG